MNQSRGWLDRARQLCGEIGEEDGVDPRLLSSTGTAEKKGHKSKQFGKAAKRVLSLKMSEFSDPKLQSLSILEVTSQHEGQSLLVILCCDDRVSTHQEAELLQKLHALEGSLRAAIARAVKRKRIPSLRFKLKHWAQLDEMGECDACC